MRRRCFQDLNSKLNYENIDTSISFTNFEINNASGKIVLGGF